MSVVAPTASLSEGPTQRPASLRLRAWRVTQHAGHLPEGSPLVLPSSLPAIPNLRYMTCQMEICPTTSRRHLQGLMYFTSLKSRAQIYSVFPCDLRRCDNLSGAIAYCQKEDTRVPGTDYVEFGDPPAQGKRKELPEFAELVKGGATKRQLIDSHPSVIARYRSFYDDVKILHVPTRTPPKTLLLVGPTGTGKSTSARGLANPEDTFVVPKTQHGWFDGYDAQDVVIFDDFKGNIPLLRLLELLDPWPVKVEVKGSFVWFTGSKIILTSNYHPKEWYDWTGRAESFSALCRRIHGVFEYTSYREYINHDTMWSPDCDTTSVPYLGPY